MNPFKLIMKNTKLKSNQYLDVPQTQATEELSSIAEQVKTCEDTTGLNIYFKRQKAFANVDTNPVKLIKASTKMCDLPLNACICWSASDQATWRLTGTNYNWHYIQFHTWKDVNHNNKICVQGDYMPAGPGAMRKTDYIMQVTAAVFKIVYNMEVDL